MIDFFEFLFMLYPLVLLIVIGSVVWFAIRFIQIQRTRNEILTEIARKLEKD